MEKGQAEQSNINYVESCLVVIAVCMLLCAKYGLFYTPCNDAAQVLTYMYIHVWIVQQSSDGQSIPSLVPRPSQRAWL